MIIECPKCKSTFNISNEMEMSNFSNFKCSICMHTWKINKSDYKAKLDTKKKLANGYFNVVILNLVILILVIIFILAKWNVMTKILHYTLKLEEKLF